MRLGRDHTIEILVRQPYRELVFGASGQERMTDVGRPGPYAITLVGHGEWLAWWDSQAAM